jgi:hypothetical protein
VVRIPGSPLESYDCRQETAFACPAVFDIVKKQLFLIISKK